MARLVLRLAFLALVVWSSYGQQQQSLHRGSDVRYGSFTQHPRAILNVAPVATSKVPDSLTCAEGCLANTRCLSYNLQVKADERGMFDCQLLAADKYNSSDRLESSSEFNHYSLLTPCAMSPCQNGGTCKPLYETQGYQCECADMYSGENCHIFENYLRRSESIILRNHIDYEQQLREYLNPVQDSRKRWKLCYRASDEGYSAPAFHTACNNKGPTVTLVRVGDNVFGGYTDKSWHSGYLYSDNAFLFSLKNRDNKAYKMAIYQNKDSAMYSASNDGPTFGGGHDLEITDECNGKRDSFSQLGVSYRLPAGYTSYSERAKSLLAGSYKFKCDEYEVFYQQ